MPCDTSTVTVPSTVEAVIQSGSVSFTGGELQGTLTYTVENTGDVAATVDIDITTRRTDTDTVMVKRNDVIDSLSAGSTSQREVQFDFVGTNMDSDTEIEACAVVNNVYEA